MVASDRISAYDYVFDKPVPDKGHVLTAMTAFWGGGAEIAPTHLVSTDPADFPVAERDRAGLAGRAMLVRRAEMLPIECVVRGYIAGSAWREYRERQTMHGERAPRRSRRGGSAARAGVHTVDEGGDGPRREHRLRRRRGARRRGTGRTGAWRCVSPRTRRLPGHALARGVIVADTKFEFGKVGGVLTICDEVVTPDSSRFGRGDLGRRPHAAIVRQAADARLGGGDGLGHARHHPRRCRTRLSPGTRARYVEAYERITGLRLADWWGGGGRT